MSEKHDGETTPEQREPSVSRDPLGLGGTTDPDAPSRHPQPKLVGLLKEFLKMTRTTAVLLVAFVLVGVLYAMVKEEPVVGIRNPAPQPPTSETQPAQPTGETLIEEEMTEETLIEETTTPTTTPQTSVPGATQQGRQAPEETSQPTSPQQAPQQQRPPQQAPPQQAPQGQGPGNSGAGVEQELAPTR